jgi:hypothetical protein
MSKKSNVHPDHYKTAGRDPQGQAVIQEVERQKFREQEAFLEKQAGRRNPAPAANRMRIPSQHRSPDTTSGQENNKEREHVNDQPPEVSAEKKPARRVAGKAKATAEKKPTRPAAAKKRASASRAAKPKSKSQKKVSKRAVEKRLRPSAKSRRK